jgi:hypothetical protein
MMAITTSSSISVKPGRRRIVGDMGTTSWKRAVIKATGVQPP